MDRSTEFEMPSLKRIRVEAPEVDPALDPGTLIDHPDNPAVQSDGPIGTGSVSVLSPDKIAFSTDQKQFQLPGLELSNEDNAYPPDIPQQLSQPYLSFSDADQTSSIGFEKDMRPEDKRMPQDDGAAVDNRRLVDSQSTEQESISRIASEMFLDRNPAGTGESQELVLEAEAPVCQDMKSSASDIAQVALDWHSSGTVVDRGVWLPGKYLIEKVPSKISDLDKNSGSRAGTSQDMDVEEGNNVEERKSSIAKLVAEETEKATSTKRVLEKLADANNEEDEAEYELDSSPFISSSSSDGSTDSSSSDDSDADDYEMLSPAEQARRLMAEDGGSGDEGKGKERKVDTEVPRTLNEKPDELVPKPTVVVTDDMKIEELGLVENTIENLALIKAKTSGEYQVLESGSLLCLQTRSVVGVVSETLGRVQQPYYSVRFTNATALVEAGMKRDTKIFYVPQHSTTVFTQSLKSFKGSDASNLHDEEVADDELEFSDDEAEAEHKRQVKQQRIARRNARDGQPDGFSRGPQRRPGRPGPRLNGGSYPVQEHPRNSEEADLNYDDADGMSLDNGEAEDGLYTPLTRPSNLHEMISGNAPLMENYASRGKNNRGRGNSTHGNRGRVDNRGRGGNRGMRGPDRGGKQNREDRGGRGQAYGHHSSPAGAHDNGFSASHPNIFPPRPRPETIGYQRSSHQSNGFPQPPPQQSPIPSLGFQAQQQAQSLAHPGYPSQQSNAYNPSYYQQAPPQSYPSHFSQQYHSQYHQQQQQQSLAHQGYPQQFASQPDMPFPPQPQYPPSIPSGAHINPNFFKQHGQFSSPQGWQQGYNQQQQQQQQASLSGNGAGRVTPSIGTASLQDLLGDLSRQTG